MSNFFIIQKRIAISNSAFLVGMSGLWSTDPHLIREVNLFAWVYKKVLEFPKNQAFWHIENEIDVNEKYTPDIN